MKRIATPTRQVDKFGAGKDGYRNGDPAAGIVATDLEALVFDHLQEAIVRTIERAGFVLSDTDYDQFPNAITKLINNSLGGAYLGVLAAVPTVKSANEIYVRGRGEMIWVETAYFVGYRSPHCGRPVDGHTGIPLAREVDAVGGLLSKTDYAGLWGYAQEENLVVTQAVWTANQGAHWFVDVSGTQFRVPNLRDMFRRYTGTDADTANARTLGSFKADTLKAHFHAAQTGGLAGVGFASGGNQAPRESNGSTNTTSTGTAETAPKHTAYNPRIHA